MQIYKITNLINSKIYIGLTTKSYLKRFEVHLKNSETLDYALYRAIRKYGKNNFKVEVVENCASIEELIKRESFWIKTLDSMNPNVGYNMINQEDWGKIFSEEVKEKMSKSQINRLSKISKEAKQDIYKKASISRQGFLKPKGSSPFIGVCMMKNGRFNCETAYLTKRYRRLFLSEIEAAEAYDKLVLYLYGANAKLNFPDKREEYLKEDLLLFVDWFLYTTQKQGRPAKKLYIYDELLEESKINAKMNIKNYNILNIDVPDLKYLYDGTINPDFLLHYNE